MKSLRVVGFVVAAICLVSSVQAESYDKTQGLLSAFRDMKRGGRELQEVTCEMDKVLGMECKPMQDLFAEHGLVDVQLVVGCQTQTNKVVDMLSRIKVEYDEIFTSAYWTKMKVIEEYFPQMYNKQRNAVSLIKTNLREVISYCAELRGTHKPQRF